MPIRDAMRRIPGLRRKRASPQSAAVACGMSTPMRRYHFTLIRPGLPPLLDQEGADFDTLEQARSEAILAAREQMSEHLASGYIDLRLAFDILDGDGRVLAKVPFSDALTFRT